MSIKSCPAKLNREDLEDRKEDFLRGLCGLRGSKYKKPINAIYQRPSALVGGSL
jgi:hypothetical protein